MLHASWLQKHCFFSAEEPINDGAASGVRGVESEEVVVDRAGVIW